MYSPIKLGISLLKVTIESLRDLNSIGRQVEGALADAAVHDV